jgi:Bacterial export proteins, family 1
VNLLLVAARLAPVTLLVPAFGGARVPWWIRIGLAFLLAGLLAPLVAPAPIAHPELFIPKELAVGVVLALLAAVPFWAAQAAGAVSDAAAGLAGRLAELLLLFATFVFFASASPRTKRSPSPRRSATPPKRSSPPRRTFSSPPSASPRPSWSPSWSPTWPWRSSRASAAVSASKPPRSSAATPRPSRSSPR